MVNGLLIGVLVADAPTMGGLERDIRRGIHAFIGMKSLKRVAVVL
jgi:hypothetical protein